MPISASLPEGTYEVRPIYTADGKDWKYVSFTPGAVDRVNLIADANGISIEGGSGPGQITFESWSSSTGFKTGSPYKVKAEVKSTYSQDVDYTLRSAICTLRDNQLYVAYDLGTKTATVPASSTFDFEYTGTIDSSFAPGEYYIAFIDRTGLVGYDIVTVEASEPINPENMALTCNSSVEGSTDGNILTVSGTNNGGFYNFTGEEGTFKIGVCLTEINTGDVFTYYGPEATLPANYGWRRFQVEVPETLPEGEYEVRPISQLSGYDWKYVIFAEGATDRFTLYSTPKGIYVEGEAGPGEITFDSWTDTTGFTVGEAYEVKATVSSSYDVDVDYTLTAALCTNDNGYFYIAQELGTETVTVAANSSAVMDFTGTISDEFEPGEYYLTFIKDNLVIAYDPVVVEDASYDDMVLSCDSSVEGSTDGRTLTVSGTNNGGFWNNTGQEGYFKLGVCLSDVNTGDTYVYYGPGQTLAPNYGWRTFRIEVPESLPEGEYEVRPISQFSNKDWKYVLFAEGATDRFTLYSTPDGIYVEGEPGPGEITFDSWSSTTGFIVGKRCDVTATFASTFDGEVDCSLRAAICIERDGGYYLQVDLGTQEVTMAANSTTDVEFSGTINILMTPGQYYLVFLKDNKIVATEPIEVTADPSQDLALTCNTEVEGSTNGRTLTVAATNGGGFWNMTGEEKTFKGGVCLTNVETGDTYPFFGPEDTLAPRYGWYSYKVEIPASLPEGEYEVRPISQADDNEWTYDYFTEGATDRFTLYSTPKGIYVEGEPGPGGVSFESWSTTTGFTAGEEYDVTATVSSTYDEDVAYELTAILCTLQDNTYYHIQNLGTAYAMVPANSTANLKFAGTIDTSLAGKYYLIFTDENNDLIASELVEVGEYVPGEIELIEWNGTTTFQVGQPYEGSLTVMSTYRHDVDYSLDLFLCVLEDDEFGIVADFGNTTVTIPAESEAEMTWSGTTPSVIPGEYYLVFAQNYNIQATHKVTVISASGLEFGGMELNPMELTTGEESEVMVNIVNLTSEEVTEEIGLHLCNVNEDTGELTIVHSYGDQEATIEANSDATVTFRTEIPEDLLEDEYYLVVTYKGLSILHYEPVEVRINTGIKGIGEDSEDYRYFNLQGVEIDARRLEPGLYIRYDGKKSTKILVK